MSWAQQGTSGTTHRIRDLVENELGSAGDEWDYTWDKGLGRE